MPYADLDRQRTAKRESARRRRARERAVEPAPPSSPTATDAYEIACTITRAGAVVWESGRTRLDPPQPGQTLAVRWEWR